MIDAGFDNPSTPDVASQKKEADSQMGKQLYDNVIRLGTLAAAIKLADYGNSEPRLEIKSDSQKGTATLVYMKFPGENDVSNMYYREFFVDSQGKETVTTTTLATGLDVIPGSVGVTVLEEEFIGDEIRFIARKGIRYLPPDSSTPNPTLLVFDTRLMPPGHMTLAEGSKDRQTVLNQIPDIVAPVETAIQAYEKMKASNTPVGTTSTES